MLSMFGLSLQGELLENSLTEIRYRGYMEEEPFPREVLQGALVGGWRDLLGDPGHPSDTSICDAL